MDRMNMIDSFFNNNLIDSNFMKTCPIQIKKYFDYKDMNYIRNDFIPNLSYSIRGFYFVPLKLEYSKILYLFPKEQSIKQQSIKQQTIKKNYLTIRIMKTLKPDVYELYLKNNDNLSKQGIALIQTTELSHKMLALFKEKDMNDEIHVKCKFNIFWDKKYFIPRNFFFK